MRTEGQWCKYSHPILFVAKSVTLYINECPWLNKWPRYTCSYTD